MKKQLFVLLASTFVMASGLPTVADAGVHLSQMPTQPVVESVAEVENMVPNLVAINGLPNTELVPYNGVNYDLGNRYAFGQCTQYVYNRITQLGGKLDLDLGNAADWSWTARSRSYQVTNQPTIGTAVVFPPGIAGADATYGHVAFVEKINDDGSLVISEMNVQGLNIVSERIILAEETSALAFISPK